MKAAVIGATGFVGGHLCDTFVGRGDAVSALVRNPDAAENLSRKGVDVVQGDLMDDDALLRLCRGADVVFNVSGVLGTWKVSSEEMERVNAHAPGRIVRCASQAGASKVIHTSTVGVTGPLPQDVCADESYPPKPATEYQRTKLAGEHAALEAHEDTGMPLVIVRPAFVYGPGDTHKLSLFRSIVGRRMILVNGGVSRLHPVYVDDLISGMLFAATRAEGKGEVYNLAGAVPVSTRTLFETIAGVLAVPAPRISLPGALLMPLARTMEITGRIIGKEPPLTRSRVKLFSESYAYSIEKAKSELKFKPVVSLPSGIGQTVEWYEAHHMLGSVRRRVNHAC